MSGPQEEMLNRLLDELEQRARQHRPIRSGEEYWICQRKHPRNPFRAACNVHFFADESQTVSVCPGRTRNLSRCGVGLLVRRVFRHGEAVEVEILLPGRAAMYLAGLVMFCRDAGHGYHEIGVSLRCVAAVPVFCTDPAAALEAHPWLLPQSVSA